MTAKAAASTAQRINNSRITSATIQRNGVRVGHPRRAPNLVRCSLHSNEGCHATVLLTLRKALALIVGVATVLATSAAVLERLIDPAFDSFSQALWFAVVTVSTVGYGDIVPESGAGRVVAATLMLTGLGLIPLITSVVVATLIAQRSRDDREEELQDVRLILERLDSSTESSSGWGRASHLDPGRISPDPHDDSAPRAT